MEREVVSNTTSHHRGEGVCRAPTETGSTDFVLQWGNRKRLRCMKFQVKDDSTEKTTVRVDRRVVRAVKDSSTHNASTTTAAANNINLNLRRPPRSSSPPPHRILRNSEILCAMKGQSNVVRGSSSPERGRGEEKAAQDKKGNNNNTNMHHSNNNGVGGASQSSDTAQDSKKEGSSPGSEAIPVWPPKFVIALTNKEKEEDFMVIKGSKLPQRPKKTSQVHPTHP